MRTRHLVLPLLLLSAAASAQEPVLQPPRLVTFVEAQYPAEAQEAHLQATVELFGLRCGEGQNLRLLREAFPEIVGELYSFGRSQVAEVEEWLAHGHLFYIIC